MRYLETPRYRAILPFVPDIPPGLVGTKELAVSGYFQAIKTTVCLTSLFYVPVNFVLKPSDQG